MTLELDFFQAKDKSLISFGNPVQLETVDGNAIFYEIHGSMQHHGETLSHGHYSCHVKHGNEFYQISDDNPIQKSTERDLKSCQVFFYKRV